MEIGKIPPQTIAKNIGESGCLALCYLKLTAMKLKDPDADPLLILCSKYNELVSRGIMDPDCFINDGSAFIKTCFGPRVQNPLVSKLTEYHDPEPVIGYNGKHFVILKDGQIIWNSLSNDQEWLSHPIKSYREVIL